MRPARDHDQTRNSSVDEIGERYGEIPITSWTMCHDSETMPPLTRTLTLCQRHGVVKFSGNADVPNSMPKTAVTERPHDAVCR